MINKLDGTWLKLADGRGEFLGILMLPADLAENVYKYGLLEVRMDPQMPVWNFTEVPSMTETIRCFAIGPSRSGPGDAVMLHGITAEEISAKRGFAFLPSAEYLRRPAPTPKPEDKVEQPPGIHLTAAREVAG